MPEYEIPSAGRSIILFNTMIGKTGPEAAILEPDFKMRCRGIPLLNLRHFPETQQPRCKSEPASAIIGLGRLYWPLDCAGRY